MINFHIDAHVLDLQQGPPIAELLLMLGKEAALERLKHTAQLYTQSHCSQQEQVT